MKPFLILQLRPIDLASDNEYLAILKYGQLNQQDVHRVRMEKDGIPEINLKDYSGVLVGGGPSNVSDAEEQKPNYQKRFEADLNKLLDKIFDIDFPFLGTCYGIGALNKYRGAEVSKEKYSEGIGPIEIELTEAGKKDGLLEGIPDKFIAYTGHKEACQWLPIDGTLLARSENCPIQIIKFCKNIYATQFHTELDEEGIMLRINVYKNHGYFLPEDAQKLMENSKNHHIPVPRKILYNFIQKYKREN